MHYLEAQVHCRATHWIQSVCFMSKQTVSSDYDYQQKQQQIKQQNNKILIYTTALHNYRVNSLYRTTHHSEWPNSFPLSPPCPAPWGDTPPAAVGSWRSPEWHSTPLGAPPSPARSPDCCLRACTAEPWPCSFALSPVPARRRRQLPCTLQGNVAAHQRWEDIWSIKNKTTTTMIQTFSAGC